MEKKRLENIKLKHQSCDCSEAIPSKNTRKKEDIITGLQNMTKMITTK